MSLAAYIDATGVHAPTYAEIIVSLQASYKGIFGSDAYLGSDSQDGQMLAIFAQAISDCNAAVVQVYNAYSPSFAQGTGLSTSVKLNGIARKVASNSTAALTIIGQAGTTINNGLVGDIANNTWVLPASVIIPPSGSISVTATAQNVGAISAGIGSISQIQTPTYGWQSATNPAIATLGNPVESDAALRIRQSISVDFPAQAIIDSIASSVANTIGVTQSTIYENATNTVDANGVPAHSVSPVVLGGSIASVAAAIQLRKPPGTATYGTTSYVVNDPKGMPITINYFIAAQTAIYVSVTIKALAGYVSSTATLIQNAIAAHINALTIGQKVYYFKLLGPANLQGASAVLSSGLTQAQLNIIGATYAITAITIGAAPAPAGVIDVPVAFNALASGLAANAVITVT